MNIKDSYIHNGTAVLKDVKVENSVLKKILAGKDANDAYLDWETVCDLTGIKPKAAGTADKVRHKLTFSGGVTGDWDGSANKTVTIPTKSSWNYDDVYLKLTGGTLTSSSNPTLNIKNTASGTSEVGIRFYRNTTEKAWIGYHDTYGVYLYNTARGKYLNYKDNGTLQFEGNTVWHAGNDGSGSTLDADLLDGTQLSKIYKTGYAWGYGRSDRPWHLVAEYTKAVKQITEAISFFVSENYGCTAHGILNIRLRAESNGNLSHLILSWSNICNINLEDFVVTHQISNGTVHVKLYCKCTGYKGFAFRVLSEHSWYEASDIWTMHNAYGTNEYCFASIPTEETQIVSIVETIKNSIGWDNVLNKPSTFPVATHDHDDTYLKLIGGELSGDLTLKVTSGDSPKLIFQRGTLTDGYDDWRIFDTGGNLKFQRTTGSTTDWKDYVIFSATAGTVTINGKTAYHAGNLTIKTLMGSTAIGDSDEPVYWNGSSFVKAGAYPTKASWNYDDRYLKLAGGTMANINVVTNLNADLLDGYHASSFYQNKTLRSDQNSIYDLRFNYGQYDKGDFNGTYKDEYPTYYGSYIALTARDKNIGALMFFDTPTNNTLGHIYVKTRGAGDSNITYSEWGKLAYLTDNVASSSKWENARTITLTGSVTGSVSIDGSSNVTLATITNHTHTKSQITDFPTSLPASGGNADRAKFLETFKSGSTTNTYGEQYPIWAQWSDNSNVRLKCTNYTVWVDKATTATKATQDGNGNVIANTYLPLSGGTLTGTLGKSNNYIFKPNGGDFRTRTEIYNGAICISLPANIGNTMLSMWIDVYNYSTNKSFSVHVGGYTYNNSTFANNPFAMVYGAEYKVRLTYDNGFKIYIGETNSKWYYPQISIRDVVLGFGHNYSNWYNDLNISFVTSFPTINSEITRYAITSDNISKQSVNYANSAGSVAWGNVTGKPSSFTPSSHTHTFASLTEKPTTISGYGITDGLRRVTLANNVENDFNTFENLTLSGRGDPASGSSLLNSPWTTQPAGGFGVLTYLWSSYGLQLAAGYNSNDLYVRNKYFSAGIGYVWSTRWDKILNSSNYNSYAPKLDGTGATGTWKINISGNAATATKATKDGNGNVITNTYLPLSGGTMSNTNVVTNLNADLLDGYHAGVTNGSVGIFVPWPNATTLKNEGLMPSEYGTSEFGHPDNVYLQSICKWAIAHYTSLGNVTLLGAIAPNSSGTCIINLYSSSGKDSTTLLPRYCSGIYITLSGNIFNFGTVDYNWYYRQVSAGYASSAGSATTSTYASNVGSSGTAGTNYVTASKVISACNWYDTMIGSDSDTVINRWSEIVNFVAGFKETPDLATFLNNNYLAKAGGTMTGPLKWKDNNALPQQTSPQYFLCIDAFDAGGTTKWASKADTLKALIGLTSTAIGDSDEPVYWNGSKFVKAGTYPTKSSWNYDDRYLKLTGGTLTGVLHLLGSKYEDSANTGALDLANSDIYGVNSIKFADLAESASEGLQWYRDATHVDSLWVKNGVIYFSPNRTWGGTVTNYTVWHSGNDGTGSGLDADLLDGKHASDFSLSTHTHDYIAKLRRLNEVFGYSLLASGMFPPALFELKTAGYPVYSDPEFASGYNSISVYNNYSNGTVTITREQAGDHANSSGFQLKITTAGEATPGCGGFYQSISSRANAIFVQIFRAKIPVGYNVNTASNPMGTNYQDRFITDRAGTGKWEWYARVVYCGSSGSFSSGGHVYLSANSGYSATSVTWYLSYCNLIDITKGAYDGLRTRYADSADSVVWSNVTEKPTTINGYGITDALKIDGSNGTAEGVSALINKLSIGSSDPTDADYYVCQYAGGGTTTTTYHRRPMSAMWSWIKAKTDTLYPTKTGSGASGTWGINIAGNAATATNVAWSGITDKPTFITWSETSSKASYSLSNAAWTNTITLPTTAGSYILNIVSGNSTLTGVFSIGASDNAKDEISLHLHGNGPRLYARTNGTTLQLSSNDASATSRSVTIKYRRMI